MHVNSHNLRSGNTNSYVMSMFQWKKYIFNTHFVVVASIDLRAPLLKHLRHCRWKNFGNRSALSEVRGKVIVTCFFRKKCRWCEKKIELAPLIMQSTMRYHIWWCAWAVSFNVLLRVARTCRWQLKQDMAKYLTHCRVACIAGYSAHLWTAILYLDGIVYKHVASIMSH